MAKNALQAPRTGNPSTDRALSRIISEINSLNSNLSLDGIKVTQLSSLSSLLEIKTAKGWLGIPLQKKLGSRHSNLFNLSSEGKMTLFNGLHLDTGVSGASPTSLTSNKLESFTGSFTLKSYRDITLEATANDVWLKGGVNIFGKLSSGNAVSTFRLFEKAGASTDDYLDISVAEHGATTISTVDAAASAASLTMDVDGDISLDPATGITKFLKAGSDDLCTLTVDTNGATTLATVDDVGLLANFTLDVDGDIELNAESGQVAIKDNTASHFLFDCDNTEFTIYDDTAEADYFKTTVAANGATTMVTVDNDGTFGHLTLQPNGALTLDPDSQNIIINATDKLSFDGRAGDQTYIQESADDVLSIYVGGDEMLKIDESTGVPGQISSQAPLLIKETLVATADVAAYGQIWVKNSTPNELYFTNDAGNDIQLTSGASAAGGGGTSYHYKMHQFYASATTDVYVPFGASTVESSSTSTTMIDDTFWIAPFDGKLVKAYLYSRTGPDETDLKLRINGTLGSSVLSGGVVDADSGSTVYSFTCDQNNTFSEGDVINLYADITTAPYQVTMTTVWEID